MLTTLSHSSCLELQSVCFLACWTATHVHGVTMTSAPFLLAGLALHVNVTPGPLHMETHEWCLVEKSTPEHS